jgi:ribose 5-phosphate isomerase B
MIALGERMLSASVALRIVDVWMATGFEGGRHVRRLEKLDALP